MPPSLYRNVVDALFGGALMVWFSGNGESLLHPAIEAILGTARDFRFVPAMLTSGSLFTEQNMRLLVEGGFFLSIQPRGGVAPCDMYLAETTMGNLLDEDFAEIWNSPKMVAMRRSVNVDPQGLCRHGTCMFRPPRAFPRRADAGIDRQAQPVGGIRDE